MRVARCLTVILALTLPACSINIESSGSPDLDSPPPASPPSPGPMVSPEINEAVGSGIVKSESRQVSGFDEVRFRGSGELLIEQTGSESLTIEAEDNILPLLTADVENGKLILGLRPGTRIVTRKPIIFRLTVKQLKAVEASGSGSTQIRGLNTDRFAFNGSGSIEVGVAGRADDQEVTFSGSGEYSSETLTSKVARVRVSGSADVVVQASESLDVVVSGSGSVQYLGNPKVTKTASGSGAVEKR